MLGEPGAGAIAKKIATVELPVASPLLEAELLAVARRDSIEGAETLLGPIEWIAPPLRLTSELRRVFAGGYLRGADAWHIATALYYFEDPSTAFFLTLDSTQRAVATALGFKTDWSLL